VTETVVCSFFADRRKQHRNAKTDYIACLRVVQESVRRAGMRHMLLTDDRTAQAAYAGGIEDVFAVELPLSLMQATTTAQARWLASPWSEGVDTVFIGADCIVLRDFRSELPGADLSIAYMKGHRKWRLNNGFVHVPATSRDRVAPLVNRIARDTSIAMFDDMLAWERGLSPMPPDFGVVERRGLKVAFLPLPKWNRYMTPGKGMDDPWTDIESANVLHFMGRWEEGKPHFFEAAKRLGFESGTTP
jgi:hypothetical protein